MRSRFRHVSLLVAALVTAASIAQSGGASGDVPAADDARIGSVFRDGISQGSGGTYGYYLKPVGGAPLYGRNESLRYQPASELKVLVHLYGMRAVQNGSDTLTSPVTIYRYPSLGEAAESPGACAVIADEVAANGQSFPLEEVHRRMMQISDNRATRALEIRYGPDGLNALAASIGMSETRFEAWPGCGVPGPPRWTSIADLAKLYESVSSLSTLDESGRAVFYRLMSTFRHRAPDDLLVRDVVLPEAEALGIHAGSKKLAKFLGGLVSHRKGGGAGGCLDRSCTRIRIIATDAGVVTIPFRQGKRVVPHDYVFGTLIKDHDITCTRDPCEGDDAAHLAAYSRGMAEMLRPAIRAALETWAAKKGRR
jgi:hypothetical protein